MKYILVTQREGYRDYRGESIDEIDTRWYEFLQKCDLWPVLVPNSLPLIRSLDFTCGALGGVLLTGGGDVSAVSGESKTRDTVENFLIKEAVKRKLPVLGVCRGAQALQVFFGGSVKKLAGHVSTFHTLELVGEGSVFSGYDGAVVNSFHNYVIGEIASELVVEAVVDGSVEAISHRRLPLFGIMWHPEREDIFLKRDINLFSKVFNS